MVRLNIILATGGLAVADRGVKLHLGNRSCDLECPNVVLLNDCAQDRTGPCTQNWLMH